MGNKKTKLKEDNGQRKKDKKTNNGLQSTIQKAKDGATRI